MVKEVRDNVKVYIVVDADCTYEYHIEAVFDSLDLAKQFVVDHNPSFTIFEYPINGTDRSEEYVLSVSGEWMTWLDYVEKLKQEAAVT